MSAARQLACFEGDEVHPRYIRVPVPGKPRIVVQEKPVPVEMPPEVVKVYDHIKVPCVSAMHFVIIVIIG